MVRMQDTKLPKRAVDSKMQGRIPKVRPRKQREDEVAKDARNLLGVKLLSWRRRFMENRG